VSRGDELLKQHKESTTEEEMEMLLKRVQESGIGSGNQLPESGGVKE
jgi:hypothetical protein